MNHSSIERRIAALERQHDPDPGIRMITLDAGDPMPEARPGEVLIIDDVSGLVAVQEDL